VDEGIFERRRYPERLEGFEYLLTEKGRGLGIVVAAVRELISTISPGWKPVQ